MNRTTILPALFLFAATSVYAQQPVTSHQAKSTLLTLQPAAGADCPLGMQASHGAGVPLARNAGSADTSSLVQRIHLTMTNRQSHEMVSAQFIVHGYSDKRKAISLANSSPTPDLAKTVDVVLDVKGKGEASSDLSLRSFTAVTLIDLSSITYADGNIWRTSSPGACSIAPGLMMLVASTQ
jgi:hypothetical protein